MDNLTGNLDEDFEIIQGTLTSIEELDGNVQTFEEQIIGQLCVDTLRGCSIQYVWSGTKLGIKTEDEEEYQFVDLAGTSAKVVVTTEGEKTTIQFIDINGTQTVELIDSSYLNNKVNDIKEETDKTISEVNDKTISNKIEINTVKTTVNSITSITNLKILEILNK